MSLSLSNLKNRPYGRICLGIFAFLSLLFIFILFMLKPETGNFPPLGTTHTEGGQKNDVQSLQLSCGNEKTSTVLWKAAERRYQALTDEKFTIVLLTHHRPKELNTTLVELLTPKIPSLLEVVIVWNNIGETPPEPFTSAHGVTVRYRATSHNSLNEKILPDPTYRTQAILLSDDDVYYHPDDLEFAFQAWRKFGKNRMVGALARCATLSEKGDWHYETCTKYGPYSMVLTNLSFVHIAFMDYYSSNDPLMAKIRAYVDEHFNCEDIAMNFLVSLITCEGPMQVYGKDPYVNAEPGDGISRRPGHMEARSKCLNDFKEMFGFMPLVDQNARIVRGPYLS